MKDYAKIHLKKVSVALGPTLELQKLKYFTILLLTIGPQLHLIHAQVNEPPLINREYPLKAIFLYNFATYIEWPSSTFSDAPPFIIGEIGNSEVNETMQAISKSKTVGERKVEFRKFSSVKEITNCQIVFISRTVPPKQQEEIIRNVATKQVLVVCESPGQAARGASINFFIEANKIRFEINTSVVKKQGLKISSKLLTMAKIVTDDK